ncbi:M20/M25/M40 family metallo-hydrolase [Saccharopolyspora erythraea]|uniref:M20/M25/M40 family metallo-hydrolase n=1 Tax=Saccharopolyspora erythraea TaxID=1836 RepID=UPI001BA8A520|nr:M20/M25/M40 family metallo-hydrolase [Saccharopolyspora erythraea]QUH04559.1 M20/M25/M40 family metallo-hydrolase [Saccharopolyspora erythraea]
MLRRLGIPLALAAMTTAVLVPGAAVAARDREWLAERMATGGSDGAVAHLAAFDRIAAGNGGNRGVGSPGFEQSLGYVADRLTGAGYEVTYQDVPYRGFHVDAERATAPDGTGVRVLMSQYGPSTAEGGLTTPLFALPAGQEDPAPGCEAADYPAHARGTIALVRTGGCTTPGKAEAAGEAGVAALLLYEVSPAPWTVLRLRAPDSLIPVGHLTQLDAEALAAQAGAPMTVELRGRDEYATTVNLFAETAGGQADDVVMAGAHLDSSSDGPGVNDNGSSVAAVLEAALRLAPYQDVVPNKVRFAFWGAEELVNIGSHHYVESLTPEQVEAIALYLNYEMLASSNYVNFVMDGDDSDHPDTGGPAAPPGSGQVEAVMAQGYRIQREPLKTADFASMRSDSEAFIAAGIPSGGAHGGIRGLKTPEEAAVFGGTAGQFYDPCYHQSCDDLAHANLAAMRASAKAVAWAVGRFAVYDEDVRAASRR